MCAPNTWRVCASDGTWPDRFLCPFCHSVKDAFLPLSYLYPVQNEWNLFYSFPEDKGYSYFRVEIHTTLLESWRIGIHFSPRNKLECICGWILSFSFSYSCDREMSHIYEWFNPFFTPKSTPFMPAPWDLHGKVKKAENTRMTIIYHIRDEFLFLMEWCKFALSEGKALEIWKEIKEIS